MAITAAQVNDLRNATGLGMMECKKALTEANGDMELAGEIVRKKYGAKMAGRTDRTSSEGQVAVAISADGSKAAMVQLNTETDFTAKNDGFKAVAQQLANLALAQDVGAVTCTPEMTALIGGISIKFGETMEFKQGVVYGGAGHKVGTYVHFTGKVGAIVDTTGGVDAQTLSNLGMHIVAAVPAPLGLNEADLPADLVAKEKAIAVEEAKASGKPQEIAEKIAIGKLAKFVDSVALLRQPFVLDDKQQVKAILPKGAEIKAFKKFLVG